MQENLITRIKDFFFNSNLPNAEDIIYKKIIDSVWELRTLESESSEYIKRKKTIIINCFEAYFKYADKSKKEKEIIKAIKIAAAAAIEMTFFRL